MKIGARVLDLWLDIHLLGPSDPNVVSRPQTPSLRDSGKNKVLFVKIGTRGFLINGLISPLPKALGPNCHNLVFRPRMPNVKPSGSEIFLISS